jgi:hypothetical protein
MITGTSDTVRISFSTSNPSMPGIITSSKTRCTVLLLKSASASSPSPADKTAYPSFKRYFSTMVLISG